MVSGVDRERVADVLDDAADVLEKRGWTQGHYADDAGHVCSIGALRCVPVDMQLRWDAEDAMEAALNIPCLITWNDAPGRTKQQVLDAFRLAAKQQRAAHPRSP